MEIKNAIKLSKILKNIDNIIENNLLMSPPEYIKLKDSRNIIFRLITEDYHITKKYKVIRKNDICEYA